MRNMLFDRDCNPRLELYPVGEQVHFMGIVYRVDYDEKCGKYLTEIGMIPR